MPNLESFLNKSSGRDWTGWEKLYGIYGCQQCENDVDIAYFNSETLTMIWVCPSNHESKVELV